MSRVHALRAPRRTIRLRLTAIYAVLFLLSGAGVLVVTYVLVEHYMERPVMVKAARVQAGAAAGGGPVIFGSPVAADPGQTICDATTAVSGPSPAQLTQCAEYFRAQAVQLSAQVSTQRADYLNTLLIDSGIALGAMTIAALGLGWLVSGRVLSPLRTITRAARNISASNLHERLALHGPDDELKELGDTVDGLLGRLEGSFAAQRQFVANASHELRTPLARQRTLMEVALADPDRTVGSLEAACRRVLAAGQQQERLIEGLLTLARSQRGLDQLEPVDLAALTREIGLARSADASQRDIQLTVVASPAVFPGDARLAERLITNLLDNAIRHNHPGGRVMVRTTSAPGQAVLSVTNGGPVIHPAEVPALFEPFRRRATARTAEGDSLGLGLSIVSAIASAHGADLHATAQASGGLQVEVRFRCQPDAARASFPQLPAPAGAAAY
ncbi:MAG TPA: ATP-binding protein [Streptosporangiaceae bacterium]|nr:ATP-binding protein [Streptosporangiaceae bacterium]